MKRENAEIIVCFAILAMLYFAITGCGGPVTGSRDRQTDLETEAYSELHGKSVRSVTFKNRSTFTIRFLDGTYIRVHDSSGFDSLRIEMKKNDRLVLTDNNKTSKPSTTKIEKVE